jgi:hypothetical protein
VFKKSGNNVGFEVFTSVTMKSTFFWDETPCSPVEVYQHFGATYGLDLQGRRINHASSQQEARGKQK